MIERGFVAAMILAAALSRATADDNVQSLYNLCKTGEGSQEFALCVGYIGGIGSVMQFMGAGLKQHPDLRPFAICGTASNGAMVQAFVYWAGKNPREWTNKQTVGVMAALRENWPCQS
jgi:hypothetical protein